MQWQVLTHSEHTNTVVSVTCGGTCGAGCSPSSGGTSGTFSDGSGDSDYGNNEDCWWLISAPGGDISVSFSSFDTESGYDYVSIYRCDTATCDDSSERILREAGTLSPSNVYSSSTGFLKVTFTSDHNTARSGFTAEWSVQGELWTCHSMSCLSAVPECSTYTKHLITAEFRHRNIPFKHVRSDRISSPISNTHPLDVRAARTHELAFMIEAHVLCVCACLGMLAIILKRMFCFCTCLSMLTRA